MRLPNAELSRTYNLLLKMRLRGEAEDGVWSVLATRLAEGSLSDHRLAKGSPYERTLNYKYLCTCKLAFVVQVLFRTVRTSKPYNALIARLGCF